MRASTPRIVVCPTCRVPFTRHGAAAGSSNFYRTREENDQCICCREGLDPNTLEPLAAAPGGTMKAANEMTDDELQRALELGASRVRMSDGSDLRKGANVLADLADEAARRYRRPASFLDVAAEAIASDRREAAISETRGRMMRAAAAMERETIRKCYDYWFTQGGAAEFGSLDSFGREPWNADELIAEILRVVRSRARARA